MDSNEQRVRSAPILGEDEIVTSAFESDHHHAKRGQGKRIHTFDGSKSRLGASIIDLSESTHTASEVEEHK